MLFFVLSLFVFVGMQTTYAQQYADVDLDAEFEKELREIGNELSADERALLNTILNEQGTNVGQQNRDNIQDVVPVRTDNDFQNNTNSQLVKSNCKINGEPVPCEEVWPIFLVIGVIFFIIFVPLIVWWFTALIHALRNDISDKAVWILVIVFVPVGFIIYYFLKQRPYNQALKEGRNPNTQTDVPTQ